MQAKKVKRVTRVRLKCDEEQRCNEEIKNLSVTDLPVYNSLALSINRSDMSELQRKQQCATASLPIRIRSLFAVSSDSRYAYTVNATRSSHSI